MRNFQEHFFVSVLMFISWTACDDVVALLYCSTAHAALLWRTPHQLSCLLFVCTPSIAHWLRPQMYMFHARYIHPAHCVLSVGVDAVLLVCCAVQPQDIYAHPESSTNGYCKVS